MLSENKAKQNLLLALSGEQKKCRNATAAELIGCLRRLTEQSTREQIYRAFGAPGDFGYHTLLGAALSSYYQSSPDQPTSAEG